METNGVVEMIDQKTEQLFRFEFAPSKMCDRGILPRRNHLEHESSKCIMFYVIYNTKIILGSHNDLFSRNVVVSKRILVHWLRNNQLMNPDTNSLPLKVFTRSNSMCNT